MSEGPKKRWNQLRLRDILVATFWIAAACGSATKIPIIMGRMHEAPIWMYVFMFSLLAAFWSLQGRYWYVLGTVAYAALFFLLLLCLHKEALLGQP